MLALRFSLLLGLTFALVAVFTGGAIMAEPHPPLKGTCTASPNPATAGGTVVVSGTDARASTLLSVLVSHPATGTSSVTYTTSAADGTFATAPIMVYESGLHIVTVTEQRDAGFPRDIATCQFAAV